MKILIAFVIRLLVFWIEIWLANTRDTGEKVWFEKKKLIAATVYLFCSAVLGKENAIVLELVSGFFWGSVAAAAYSDWQIKKAYDFQNWIAMATGAILLIIQGQINRGTIIELAIFFLIQAVLCRYAYGAADGMCYSACAVYMAAFGYRLSDDMFLITVSLLLLLIVQIFKRNVNKWGNLKEARAFLPYIAASMLLFCK